MALRKPSSISSTTNPPSGSTLIKQSSGVFVLKMWDFDFHHRVNDYAPTTGDGDANPVYEHNQMQDGRYTIRGAMVQAAAMGLANLSSSSNPGTVKLKLDSTADTGTFHNFTALVLSVSGKWRRTGVFIPVVIDCILTSTTPSSIEAST
jgi:hypothetical protein